MLALTAQVWNARRISRCQEPGGPAELNTLARVLGPSGVEVPLGARLNVRWLASGQGMPKEEGRRHWREVHGPLGRAVPQIERYVQSHAVEALGPVEASDVPLAYDGYSCCWFADEESYREAIGTPEWADIGADGANLFDPESFAGMSAVLDEWTIVEENVVKP